MTTKLHECTKVVTLHQPRENCLCTSHILMQTGDMKKVKDEFPFTKFFENAPQPIFKERSYEEDMDMAEGCFRHIKKIFTELDVSTLCHWIRVLRGVRYEYFVSLDNSGMWS